MKIKLIKHTNSIYLPMMSFLPHYLYTVDTLLVVKSWVQRMLRKLFMFTYFSITCNRLFLSLTNTHCIGQFINKGSNPSSRTEFVYSAVKYGRPMLKCKHVTKEVITLNDIPIWYICCCAHVINSVLCYYCFYFGSGLQ